MWGVLPVGCGQCLPCRINRRRVWTHRMILESVKHAKSAFVSLTYASEHLPVDASLRPRDAQLWLKRLRKAVGKLRYFLCGEYGDETFRPHYHAAVFGLDNPVCVGCRHQYKRSNCDCVVARSWGLGHVFVGDLTPDSASYVAGYVTKKLTKDSEKLRRKPCVFEATCTDKWCMRKQIMHPEFSRMSLRPGIGAPAMHDVAIALTSTAGAGVVLRDGAVPIALSHGRKSLPLGRYLTKRLTAEAGYDEETCKAHRIARWSLEVEAFLLSAFEDSANCNKSVARIFTDESRQKALNQEARFKIYGKKKGKL